MTQLNAINNTPYTKKASSYVNIINELRRIGTDSTVSLPTIVFCGNQSAGKSSLIEAISGVKLPRSDGTCTRCVMEIRLSEYVDEWMCQVFLRKEYDENENRLNRPIESKFGSLIINPDDVELMARRAQKALLNPRKNSDIYFNWDFGNKNYDDDSKSNAIKFTKNVVCIEIKGPDVPNLSLIDLPGIIRYTEKSEDEKFIALIEELVKEYIEKEKSIIVATISCKDDIDNQAIVSLAKNADISGIRTLGVLTKPDTIEEGTHDKWLKIMKNEAHKLDLGYFVVKNPSQKHLNDGITFEEAREDEISLEKIPEKLSDNPSIEIYRMAKQCCSIIKAKTACSNNQIDLWQSINKKFEYFKQELYSSRPIFTVGNNETEIDLLDEYIKTKVIEKTYSNKYTYNNSINECKELTTKYIDLIYQMQSSNPFTLDDKSITSQKSIYLSAFHEVLKRENQEPTSTLEIMALVMAYFKLALNRYVDIIAMTIIHTFIDQFTKHIEERMIGICVLDGKYKLDELIKEDDTIKQHRDYLTNLEKNLKE
ncbi:2253_t:CDS:2, partial [Racocetra fulgida]